MAAARAFREARTGRRIRAWLCALCAAAAAPAAGAPTDALAPGERGIVVSALDGDTLALASGLEVRLAGVQAPKRAPGQRGTEAALAEEARGALSALAGGRTVTLRYGGARRDRYGRAVAHPVRDDGLWLQGAMLRAGLARVRTLADNRALATEMYAAERAARAARRGIWSHPRYRVRAPDDLDDAIDSFRIVEGRTVAATRSRGGRIYLNFGDDRRSDFTVAIARSDRELFESAWAEAGFAPVSALAGRRIRVRGWLRADNGPLIEADHPEQIELLDAPDGE